MRVNRPIRFEYDTCGRGIFESGKIKKHPDTSGQGLKHTYTTGQLHKQDIITKIFFLRGHENESCNLIGS